MPQEFFMRSMTGLGVGEAPLGDGKVIVSVRSLNHRYLDMRVRTPSELSDLSFAVERRARELLSRGRYDVTVRVEGPALPAPRLSQPHARALFEDFRALRDDLAPDSPMGIEVLGSMAALITAPATDAAESAEPATIKALEQALDHLDEMRNKEGGALQREMKLRLAQMREERSSIADRIVIASGEHAARVRERLDRLLKERDLGADEARLETELALLAERGDITEELVRLESHFDQLEQLIDSGDKVGRRIDFLLQEVGREANTVGSKSQDATMSHTVVNLKAEIERMREQVQNVE
jgi:uncharacterized protein (TIGR00255 family)